MSFPIPRHIYDNYLLSKKACPTFARAQSTHVRSLRLVVQQALPILITRLLVLSQFPFLRRPIVKASAKTLITHYVLFHWQRWKASQPGTGCYINPYWQTVRARLGFTFDRKNLHKLIRKRDSGRSTHGSLISCSAFTAFSCVHRW